MNAQLENYTTSLNLFKPFLFKILERRKETQIIYAMCLTQKLRVPASPADPLIVNYLIYGT